jgi:hypothetical protein
LLEEAGPWRWKPRKCSIYTQKPRNQFNWKRYVFKYYFIPENGVAMHRGNCLCDEVVQAGEEGGGRVRLQAVHLGQDITKQGTLIISSRTLARR